MPMKKLIEIRNNTSDVYMNITFKTKTHTNSYYNELLLLLLKKKMKPVKTHMTSKWIK